METDGVRGVETGKEAIGLKITGERKMKIQRQKEQKSQSLVGTDGDSKLQVGPTVASTHGTRKRLRRRHLSCRSDSKDYKESS